MKITKVVFLLALASLSLTGCSIKGSIEDLTASAKTVVTGTQSGLSSGATAVEVVNGYSVSSSIGSYTDAIHETKSGYNVYLGLQGSSSSEVVSE